MGHHDESRIQADYELSERLGAELEAAGCMPLDEAPIEIKTYFTYIGREWCVNDNGCEVREVLVTREGW